MKFRAKKVPAAKSAKLQHREWLSLVEVYGPFLSLEVLEREFPQGLDSHDAELTRRLRSAYEEWQGMAHDPAYHREWLNFLLQEVLAFPAGCWKEGTEIPPGCQAHLPQHGETLSPDRVLLDGEKVRWLLSWVPPRQKLDRPVAGRNWVADPIWRMVELLHATGHPLGLVSNGEHFAVVSAPLGEPSGVANFYAELWLEEPLTLQAFRTLFGVRRFLGVPLDSGPEALFKQSAEEQHQVTTALGKQVLQAVELLISELDRLDRGSQGELLRGVDERELFRAALTVMMRLIFLLSAEERGLLPLNNQFYQEHYAVSPLAQMLREVADRHGEEILTRREDAWVRLLATFRAVYAGVQHEDMHLPAYGGSLFDPDQFSFLEGRPKDSHWQTTPASPLLLHNRLVLYLLESLQTLKEKGEVLRRVSFRALDVEQLGHVYESLLDHTVKRSPSAVLGLKGKTGKEPEIELALLQDSPDSALQALASATGRKPADLQKEVIYDTPPENPFLRDRCEDDRLYHQILPFQKLLREDAMGNSVIFPPGGAYVTQSTERRESGAHYTPRSLTEEMVQHTLDPLLYPGMNEGIEPTPERLLQPQALLSLKVLDLAMGSGAFLVQACRYLAERLLESWQRYGPPEDLPLEPEARLAVARRQVAESCLFGVDRDPLAVEMAKLSLWLLTLDQQKPFSFLDHALRCGDSLLGLTSVEQIRQQTLQPSRGQVTSKLSHEQVEGALLRARQARGKLESFTVVDPRDAEQKAALLREAQQATAELRRLGDLIVAAAIQSAGGKGFDARLEEMLALPNPPVQKWLNQGKPDSAPDRQPFHWAIEFPEVFEAGGFDAIVGNPPFLGGQKLTGSLGVDYREYLVQHLARSQRGSADLVAYFFLRAGELLKGSGNLGLVATNTLAQGDTREVGLDQLTRGSISLFRARPTLKWPGGAKLEVAQVWGHVGPWNAACFLCNQSVLGITSGLDVKRRFSGKPHRLTTNAGGSYLGVNVFGAGFVLEQEEAHRLLAQSARNAEVIQPFMTGEDLTSRPDLSPRRFIINFRDWPLERAMSYPECFALVESRVKPQRLLANRDSYRARWWQFAEGRRALTRCLQTLSKVIVTCQTAKFHGFAMVPTNCVFSTKIVVFVEPTFEMLSVLQSNVHRLWCVAHGSTLKTDPVYTPSDCYETFPFPANYESSRSSLASLGQSYSACRTDICLSRQEGVTQVYNRFHNPSDESHEIQALRKLHQSIDQEVCALYGWADLTLRHGWQNTTLGPRWTIHPNECGEILDRLMELNYTRHQDEVEAPAAERKPRKKAVATVTQLPLFEPQPSLQAQAEALAGETQYLAADATVPAGALRPVLTEGLKKRLEVGDETDKLI